MKLTIGQRVIANGKKCIVIATKDIPHKPAIDPFNRAEIYPDNDALLFIYFETVHESEHFKGMLDVYFHELEIQEW